VRRADFEGASILEGRGKTDSRQVLGIKKRLALWVQGSQGTKTGFFGNSSASMRLEKKKDLIRPTFPTSRKGWGFRGNGTLQWTDSRLRLFPEKSRNFISELPRRGGERRVIGRLGRGLREKGGGGKRVSLQKYQR